MLFHKFKDPYLNKPFIGLSWAIRGIQVNFYGLVLFVVILIRIF